MTTDQIQPMADNKKKSHWFLWLLSVVIAFILGFLLARYMCEHQKLASSVGDGKVFGTGALSSGPGARVKLGDGYGNVTSDPGGKSGATGADTGNGFAAHGTGGAAGDGGKGGGNGHIPADSGMLKDTKTMNDTALGNYVAKLASGKDAGTAALTDTTPAGPGIIQKVASDFSLDRTGSPRYPTQLSVMSAIAMRQDDPGDTTSSAGIKTGDSFDKVASWYQAKLPPNWKETRMDDMAKTAAQLNPQNIMKMLSSAMSGAPSGAPSVADSSAAPAAPAGPGIAIWEAPEDGSHIKRSVMVTSKPGEPTLIIMSRVMAK